VRYLTRAFAVGALRRGSEIEQFLGPVEVDGVAGIRWVSIGPWHGSYRILLHTAQDLDDERFADLYEFPPLYPEDEDEDGDGHELGRVADETESIELAQRLTGADPDRWVNFAIAGEEYLDLVRSRRTPAADTGHT
jgi:hypothetical protein